MIEYVILAIVAADLAITVMTWRHAHAPKPPHGPVR